MISIIQSVGNNTAYKDVVHLPKNGTGKTVFTSSMNDKNGTFVGFVSGRTLSDLRENIAVLRKKHGYKPYGKIFSRVP